MSLGNCIVLKGSVSFRLLLGGSDPYTGWGFTTESDAHIKEVLPYSPSSYHLRLSTNNPVGRAEFLNTLQTDPLFRKEPGILFGDSASVFAGATVGTCGFTFNYDLPERNRAGLSALQSIPRPNRRDWIEGDKLTGFDRMAEGNF